MINEIDVTSLDKFAKLKDGTVWEDYRGNSVGLLREFGVNIIGATAPIQWESRFRDDVNGFIEKGGKTIKEFMLYQHLRMVLNLDYLPMMSSANGNPLSLEAALIQLSNNPQKIEYLMKNNGFVYNTGVYKDAAMVINLIRGSLGSSDDFDRVNTTLKGTYGYDVSKMFAVVSSTSTEIAITLKDILRQMEKSTEPALPYKVAGLTDIGNVRDTNQDSYYNRSIVLRGSIQPEIGINLGGVFIVADGMGGMEEGKVASRIVIDEFHKTASSMMENAFSGINVSNPSKEEEQYIIQVLSSIAKVATSSANYEVYRNAQMNGKKMGSTIVAALRVGNIVVIPNVGDSRAYLSSSDTMEQISVDHSYTQMKLEAGAIKPANTIELHHDDDSNILLRSMGNSAQVEPDITVFKLKPGDRFLLCTDGLWNNFPHIDEAKSIKDAAMRVIDDLAYSIQGYIRKNDIKQGLKDMVKFVKEKGLHKAADNITGVIVEY